VEQNKLECLIPGKILESNISLIILKLRQWVTEGYLPYGERLVELASYFYGHN
jgi:hypothetical protein